MISADSASHVAGLPAPRVLNVLFLCTGNSGRSILAETLVNREGGNRFRAYSAGSHAAGLVNLFALELLREQGLPTEGLRSKSWDEFARAGAPPMDLVITVCDDAAGEVCPVWPGHPLTAHWSVADPAAVQGTDADKRRAFKDAFRILSSRVRALASLPVDELDRASLHAKLREIGDAT